MSSPDWRRLVADHAARSGATLPDGTLEELAQHLEDLHRRALEDGATEQTARDAAMEALTTAPLAALSGRPASRPRPVSTLTPGELTPAGGTGSLRAALRASLGQFRHHPSFAVVAVLVLGLGVAATTTVFTVIDSVVLRPLPYPAPDRLLTLWDTNVEAGLAHERISPVNFMDYRELPGVEDAAAWWRPSLNLVDPGLDPVRVNAVEASANLFSVLGVTPQLGPGFPRLDTLYVSNQPTVVISDRLWRTRYGADASLVGRRIELNSIPHQVVGVMPPGFHYPDDVDVWQLLQWDLRQHSRAAHFMEAVLRLRAGTTAEQAQASADALAVRLQEQFAGTNRGWNVRLVPVLDEQLGYYRPALYVLFGAVGLLLLIGCLNVASLLLVRAVSREHEVAVRVALGASPRQLLTQLLAESLTLSLAGAAVGMLATAVLLPVVTTLAPVAIPRMNEAAVAPRTFGLALGIVAGATLVFGLVPSLVLLRRGLVVDLKSGARGGRRVQWVYSAFVASEVALACALLVASALLVRTVTRMMTTPTGINGDRVLVTTVQLPIGTFESWGSVADTYRTVVERLRSEPNVQGAGASNVLPLEAGWRVPFGVVGEPGPARPEDAPQSQIISVTDGYFESLGVAPIAGRLFAPSDTRDATPVVVVNESFARRHLGAQAPVGRRLSTSAVVIGPLGINLTRVPAQTGRTLDPDQVAPPRDFEVVGVVPDVRNAPLGQATEPAVYFSAGQFPFREMHVTVLASNRAAALAAVRRTLKDVAPTVPLGRVETWPDRLARGAAEQRLLMLVLIAFGSLAGLLAAVGVYGLFSWSVALRTRELAIRVTLGAPPATVGALVLRQSVVLAIGGIAAGFAMVVAAGPALARVLFEVSPTDAASMTAAAGLLVLTALVACLPPALRAMRVDPVEGLRAD